MVHSIVVEIRDVLGIVRLLDEMEVPIVTHKQLLDGKYLYTAEIGGKTLLHSVRNYFVQYGAEVLTYGKEGDDSVVIRF